ncbi:hypothetical protein [Streptomyces glaucosporus]
MRAVAEDAPDGRVLHGTAGGRDAMARGRPVALATAVVLVLEAVGIGVLFWAVGVMADRQEMSLDGLGPHLVAASARTCGAVLGVHLVLCGALLLRAALTGRPASCSSARPSWTVCSARSPPPW